MSIESFLKDPGDKVDCGFDWAGWLEGDTITDSTWTAAGLTIESESASSTGTSVFVSGGTHGVDYMATNQITTSGGRIKQRSIKIVVREQ